MEKTQYTEPRIGHDRRHFHYEIPDEIYEPIQMDGHNSGVTVDYYIVIDPPKEYNLKYWNADEEKYQWLVAFK